jgi:hypothetical protein
MKSHRSRTWLFYVVGVIVLAMVALWVINMLLGLLFKIVVVALVVAGAVYVFGRSPRRLDQSGPRRLGR